MSQQVYQSQSQPTQVLSSVPQQVFHSQSQPTQVISSVPHQVFQSKPILSSVSQQVLPSATTQMYTTVPAHVSQPQPTPVVSSVPPQALQAQPTDVISSQHAQVNPAVCDPTTKANVQVQLVRQASLLDTASAPGVYIIQDGRQHSFSEIASDTSPNQSYVG